MNFICRPVFYLKHDVSETELSQTSGGIYSVGPKKQPVELVARGNEVLGEIYIYIYKVNINFPFNI
jgi:hypothetical protein